MSKYLFIILCILSSFGLYCQVSERNSQPEIKADSLSSKTSNKVQANTFEKVDTLTSQKIKTEKVESFPKDSTAKFVDSTRASNTKKQFITDLCLVFDYGKLIGFIAPYENKMEGGVRITFGNKLFLASELGTATLEPDAAYKDYKYQSYGNYFRFGLGKMSALSNKSNLGLGIFYARSNFQDDLSSSISELEEISRSNLAATWAELNIISESQLYKNIYAGINFRVRVMLEYDKQENYDVYSIPGYGRTFDKSIPAVNLFLKYKLF